MQRNFSVVLFIMSILLLIFSSSNTITTFSIKDILGLAERLHVSYWFGLFLIMVSLLLLVFDNKDHEKLFLIEVFILALYLYAIPALVEENLYFYDSWMHLSRSMYILIAKSYNQPLTIYPGEFPGAFVLQSIIILITGINPVTLTKYYPLLFSGLIVLTSYIVLRRLIFDKKMLYLAMIFFISGSVWVFPKHFCPNSIALIWYLLIFYLAFSRKSIRAIGLSIFLTCAIIVSHAVTLPFLILSTILIPTSLIMSKKLPKLKEGCYLGKHWSLSRFFPVVVLIMWLAWLIFNAIGELIYIINKVVNFFMSLVKYITLERVTERLYTTPYHSIGETIKISYTILYVSISIIGALYLTLKIFKENEREHVNLFITMISWIMACGIFGVATAFLQGGELFERPILFGFIPLSVLAAFTYKNRYAKVLFISVLLIGAPLSVFAAYTSESFEYSPTSDVYGSLFLINHGIIAGLPNSDFLNNITVGTPTSLIYIFYNYYWVFQSDLDPKDLSSSKGTVFIWSQVSENFYFILFKETNYTILTTTELNPKFVSLMDKYSNVTSRSKLNLIYNNGDFRAWFVVGNATEVP